MRKLYDCGTYVMQDSVLHIELMRSITKQVIDRYCIGLKVIYDKLKEEISNKFNNLYDNLDTRDFLTINKEVSELYDYATDTMLEKSIRKRKILFNAFVFPINERFHNLGITIETSFVEKFKNDINLILDTIFDCYITSFTFYINDFVDELHERSEKLTGKINSPYYEMILTPKTVDFDLNKYVCTSSKNVIVYELGGIRLIIPNRHESIILLEKCVYSSDILALLVGLDFSI